MRRTRFATTAVALAGASLLLVGCTTPGGDGGSERGDEDPYQVLIISGVTGALSVNSDAIRTGIDAAVDSINEDGGINGREIETTVVDDQSDATRAVTLLQEYIADNGKPDLVIAGQTSNEVFSMVPILTRENIIGISTTGSPDLNDPEKYPTFFGTSLTFADTAGAAAEYMKDEGAKKVAVVIVNDATRETVEPFMKETLEDLGIEDTGTFAFDPEAIDLSSTFAEAAATNPDWIYMDGNGAVVPRLFEGRLKAGAEDIPVTTGLGPVTSGFDQNTTPEQRENVYTALAPMNAYIDPSDRTPAMDDLIERVGDLDAATLTLNTYAYGWDFIQIWAAAVEQAGTADTDEVVAALEDLDLSGEDAADQPWIMWRNLYTKDSHYPAIGAEDVLFSQVTGERKDAMMVLAN